MNQKKRKPISQTEMAANPHLFYNAKSSFKKDALRPYTFVLEVGLDQIAPLYIAVEWDTKLVRVGYTRNGGAWDRIERGIEEWFHPSQYLSKDLQEAIRRFEHIDACEIHAKILKLALDAQKILDETINLNYDTKLVMRALLDRCHDNEKIGISIDHFES